MFQRRLVVFALGLLAAMGVLAWRLVQLQLVRGEHYVSLAQEALEIPGRFLETVRGKITDCRGRALAVDQPSYEVQAAWRLIRLYDGRYRAWMGLTDAQQPEEGIWELYLSERAQAQGVLGDVAAICMVPVESLEERLREIGDRVYALAAMQALKKEYRARGEAYPHGRGAAVEEVLADFERLAPSAPDRLERLHDVSNAVLEMRQGHVLVEDIGEDAALTIEERLVGGLLEGTSVGAGRRMVWVQTGKVREYPYGRSACHLVGQLMPVRRVGGWQGEGDPNESELAGDRAGDRRGEWGAERMCEFRLRGRRGWVRRDRQGQELMRIEPLWGQDVRLTIDMDLQQEVERILEGENDHGEAFRGAVVVVEVATGAVRAAASAPGFDVNRYYEPEMYAALNEVVQEDPGKRKYNRALSVNYEPGSTLKPTLLAGAFEGGVELGEFECRPDYMDIMGRSLCRQYGHGWLGPKEAIQRSCGFYFIELGRRMGVEQEVAWLGRAGFGRRVLAWPMGVEAGEAFAAFRETAGHLGRGGRVGRLDQAYMSVGLAVVDGSIVGMANTMATVAREGVWVAPYLVELPRVEPERFRLASVGSVHRVWEGMWAAVNEVGGTAYEAFGPLRWAGVNVYGKTGSTSDNSLFGGFARAADGRCVALEVVVEDDRGGGKVAAPVARRVFAACGKMGYLPAAEEALEGQVLYGQ